MNINYETSELTADSDGNRFLSIQVDLDEQEQYYTSRIPGGVKDQLVAIHYVNFYPNEEYSNQIKIIDYGKSGRTYELSVEERVNLQYVTETIAFVRANLESICKVFAVREAERQERAITGLYENAKSLFERKDEAVREKFESVRDMWKMPNE